MSKFKKLSTPNPGGNPGRTPVAKKSASLGPTSSFGKPGKALGTSPKFGEFSNHGNQRGR